MCHVGPRAAHQPHPQQLQAGERVEGGQLCDQLATDGAVQAACEVLVGKGQGVQAVWLEWVCGSRNGEEVSQ